MALILLIKISIGQVAFEAGEYRLAELELRRELFAGKGLTREESLMLGTCYLKDNNYLRGSRILKEIIPEGNYTIARYYLATGNYQGAEVELRDLMLSDHSDSIKEMLGLALLLNGEIEEAKDFIDLEGVKFKNPKTAALLSTIIPGAGEIYGGKPFLGILDLTVNGVTDYLLFRSITQKEFLDATIILYFLFFRFYNGSRGNAYLAAVEHNEKIINQILSGKGLKRWLQF